MGVLLRQRELVFDLRILICFLKAGILGEVSGEDLNRIFISFMLMRQNEIYPSQPPTSSVWGLMGTKGTNWVFVIYLPE